MLNSARWMVVVSLCVGLLVSSGFAAQDPPAKLLVAKISGVSFTKEPLSKVLAKYAELSGLAVEADWPALKADGLDKDSPITFKADNLNFDKLLDTTLVAITPKQAEPLAWFLEGRTVRVSTQTKVLLKDRITNFAAPAAAGGKTAAAETPRPTSGREISFENTPLKMAMEFLRDLADVNMHVNWKALETAGISQETPITLKAKGLSTGRALDMVLDQINANHDKLASVYWIIDDGVVEITTGEALNQKTKTVVYDIADLLFVVPNFQGPQMNLNSNASGNNNTGGNNGPWSTNNTTNASGNNGTGGVDNTDMAAARQKIRDDLVSIIKDTIGEDMWAPTGKGSIKIMGSKLVITQTQLGLKLLEKSFSK